MSQKRVLIVDDEPLVRKGTQRVLTAKHRSLLNMMGVSVETASNRQEAFDLVSATPGDSWLIITDMEMLGKDDGLQLARSIRQLTPPVTARIVLHSSTVAEGHAPDPALDAAYHKPLDSDGLHEELEKFLQPE